MKKTWLLLAGSLLLTACQDSESENTATAPVVRGLKTVLVEDQERTTSPPLPKRAAARRGDHSFIRDCRQDGGRWTSRSGKS